MYHDPPLLPWNIAVKALQRVLMETSDLAAVTAHDHAEKLLAGLYTAGFRLAPHPRPNQAPYEESTTRSRRQAQLSPRAPVEDDSAALA